MRKKDKNCLRKGKLVRGVETKTTNLVEQLRERILHILAVSVRGDGHSPPRTTRRGGLKPPVTVTLFFLFLFETALTTVKIAFMITIKHVLNESIRGGKKRKNRRVKREMTAPMFLSEVDSQIFIFDPHLSPGL